MGGNISQRTKVVGNVTTTTTEEISSSCSGTCSPTASNNTVIVGGRAGNISITAKCTVSATCVMSNQVVENVDNALATAVEQDAKTVTGIFGGGIIPSNISEGLNIQQALVTNLTGITQSTCQASSVSNSNNNFIYVEPSGAAGRIVISSDSDVNASCTMTNLAKAQVQNKISNNLRQKAKHISLIAYVFMVILAIVVIGAVVLVILGATGVLSSAFKGGGSGSSQPNQAGSGTSPTDLANQAQQFFGGNKTPGKEGNLGGKATNTGSQNGLVNEAESALTGGGGEGALVEEGVEAVAADPELLALAFV